jgi:hypothetical protein
MQNADQSETSSVELQSIGTADAHEAPPAAYGSAVTAVVLLPTEESHATAVDQVIVEEIVRLGRLGRRAALIGIAPVYPLLVRMIPGGVASGNRLKDAAVLQTRCDHIRAQVEARGAATAAINITVVASGDRDTSDMILDACRESRTEAGVAFVQHIMIVPDGGRMAGYTNGERLVHAILLLPEKERPPVTLLRDPKATPPRPLRAPARHVALCVLDMDAATDVVPRHVRHALRALQPGDGVVLHAPIHLPEVSDAMQLSSMDWQERLQELMKATNARLHDTKEAVVRYAKALGLTDLQVGTVTSEKHHMQAIEDAIETFAPALVALSPGFRRQWVMRNTWEKFRGAEYERIARAHAYLNFLVV